MWRHATFPSKADPLIYYPSKDRHVLSGSVPEKNTKALIEFFARFEKPKGAGLVHFTLSLPAGIQLYEEHWHEVARHVLSESGLPSDIVSWVVWGGEQTNCNHYTSSRPVRLLRAVPLRLLHLSPSHKSWHVTCVIGLAYPNQTGCLIRKCAW